MNWSTLRVLDGGGQVSLTNLVLAATAVRIVAAPNVVPLVAFALALAAYVGKKVFAAQAATKQVSDTARLDKLENEVKLLISPKT